MDFVNGSDGAVFISDKSRNVTYQNQAQMRSFEVINLENRIPEG